MSRVDVVVPCYNYGRFVRQAAESVLSQEGIHVRVLIIDDASTDDSEAVGRQLAAEDPRVEYRRHATNTGHLRVHNEGIDWLTGDYCMLLSADDMVTPGAFARAAAVMDRHPEVVLTYGRAIETPEPRPEQYTPVPDEWKVRGGRAVIETMVRLWNNIVPTPTAIGRTATQKAIGGYDLALPHSGDLEMWLRYAARGAVAVTDARQAYYRRHAVNMSKGYTGARECTQLQEAFDAFFEKDAHLVPAVGELKALSDRGLAVQALYVANDLFNAGDVRRCDDFLRLAAARWPGIREHRGWRRLAWKRRFGAGVVTCLRRLCGRPAQATR
ncbi:MAG TPA: glycosyltransferase family A protein [Gemmataceae bacterium]|nr:glycosyltransferase family A protein [Gemmataceae bacterium]